MTGSNYDAPDTGATENATESAAEAAIEEEQNEELAQDRLEELEREKGISDEQLAQDRASEKAAQAAAIPAPPVEHRFPGEISGTLYAEDVNTHEHERAGSPEW